VLRQLAEALSRANAVLAETDNLGESYTLSLLIKHNQTFKHFNFNLILNLF
jgi:hypothetical protein